MKFLIAKKLEMTQRYQDDGTVVPVTVLQAGPCRVTQVKTKDKDGYDAVQIGFGKAKKVSKPQQGHLKAVGEDFKVLREFRIDDGTVLEVGASLEAGQFEPGDFVQVTGTSKGKGFQGVVKRHGFKGSPASHGHKDQLRMPGSIGATGPARVFKGTRMGGHMGAEQVTVKNLEVVRVDPEQGTIEVKGAVPGARGAVILVAGGQKAKQSWK